MTNGNATSPLRLLVMGTGPFAVPMFARILEAGQQVLGLVTRPDRPIHARQAAPQNPMRELARRHGLEVFEPESINAADAQQRLADFAADLFVVCDYGQILAPATIGLARLGGINLHGSLLPRYRGAAPIQWAIYHGETTTGVTVLHITPTVDAGPILVQSSTPIGPTETAADLEPRLAAIGADAVQEALALLASGNSPPGIPQDSALASRAPRLKKTDGLVDWRRPAAAIFNQWRAMQPWPKTYTFWHPPEGQPVRLILESVTVRSAAEQPISAAPPGTVVVADKELLIACGENRLSIERLQPAGKRAMSAVEFLRGHEVRVGQTFSNGPAEE